MKKPKPFKFILNRSHLISEDLIPVIPIDIPDKKILIELYFEK